MTRYQKTVAVDFDGVLHSYTSPFSEIPADPPAPHALELIETLLAADYKVVIFTTRGKTVEMQAQVTAWLAKYDFPAGLEVTAEKPMAIAFIDDRAINYEPMQWNGLNMIPSLIRRVDRLARRR